MDPESLDAIRQAVKDALGEALIPLMKAVEDLKAARLPAPTTRLAGVQAIAVSIDGEIATGGVLDAVNEDSEVHFIPALGGGKG